MSCFETKIVLKAIKFHPIKVLITKICKRLNLQGEVLTLFRQLFFEIVCNLHSFTFLQLFNFHPYQPLLQRQFYEYVHLFIHQFMKKDQTPLPSPLRPPGDP